MEIVGVDEDKYIPEYTEAQRIGIAIGVALAILVVVLIVIYFVVSCYPRYSARIYTFTCDFSEQQQKKFNPAFFSICKVKRIIAKSAFRAGNITSFRLRVVHVH